MQSPGLSPFLGDRSLSDDELHKFVSVVDTYLNKERMRLRYFYAEKSHTLLMNLIVKLRQDSFDIFSRNKSIRLVPTGMVEKTKQN